MTARIQRTAKQRLVQASAVPRKQVKTHFLGVDHADLTAERTDVDEQVEVHEESSRGKRRVDTAMARVRSDQV